MTWDINGTFSFGKMLWGGQKRTLTHCKRLGYSDEKLRDGHCSIQNIDKLKVVTRSVDKVEGGGSEGLGRRDLNLVYRVSISQFVIRLTCLSNVSIF